MRYSRFPQRKKREKGTETDKKVKKKRPSYKKDGKYSENQSLPNMGDFKIKIVKLLSQSKTPLSPTQIGKKLKKSEAFVFVWLSSIGKSIKEIKKVGIGKYSYKTEEKN
jgi:hypothetical protein